MKNKLEQLKIATRYAKALMDTVDAQSSVDPEMVQRVQDDLVQLADLTQNTPDFIRFFENPAVPAHQKQDFLTHQILPGLDASLQRLLPVLLENDRMAVLPFIAERFAQLQDERNQVATAEVTSVLPLNEALQAKVRATLESVFGYRRVNIENRIEPAILGGLVIKIQDRIIDGSYRGRLEEMRKRLLAG